MILPGDNAFLDLTKYGGRILKAGEYLILSCWHFKNGRSAGHVAPNERNDPEE